ncbi:MAG: VanZ family protein [Planctomycetaceae bacterium]
MSSPLESVPTVSTPSRRGIGLDEETGLLGVLLQPDFQIRWLPRFVLLGYWVLIFTLTHIPIVPTKMPAQVNDKVVHFCMYFGLAFLLPLWSGWLRPMTVRGFASGLLILFAYAVTDELLQIPVGRSCEFFDGVADMIGGTCGLLAASVVRRHWVEQILRGAMGRIASSSNLSTAQD